MNESVTVPSGTRLSVKASCTDPSVIPVPPSSLASLESPMVDDDDEQASAKVVSDPQTSKRALKRFMILHYHVAKTPARAIL